MGSRGSGGHTRSGPPKDAYAGLPDSTSDCSAPGGMTAEARVYWEYFAPLQAGKGLLTLAGRFLLRRYCQLQAHLDRVIAAMDASEVLMLSSVVDAAGNERIKAENNPLGSRAIALSQQLHTLESDLCLSPAAAMRLPARPVAEQDDLEAWAGPRPKMRAVK